MFSDTLKMSPTVSDASGVYLRAGLPRDNLDSVCMGGTMFTSQLLFASNKYWSKGEGKTSTALSLIQTNRSNGGSKQLVTDVTDQKGGSIFLGGISWGLQRPLRESKEGEMLTVRPRARSVCGQSTVQAG